VYMMMMMMMMMMMKICAEDTKLLLQKKISTAYTHNFFHNVNKLHKIFCIELYLVLLLMCRVQHQGIFTIKVVLVSEFFISC